MKKYVDHEIAALAGYGAALELASLGAALDAKIESIKTIRKAQGRPLLENEGRDRAEFAELMDAS